MIAQDLASSSWSCIHFVSAAAAPPLRSALPGQVQATIDSSHIEGDRQLFAVLAEALGFPEYFGMNWDAVDDCLQDLSWLPGTGYTLFVGHATRLWERAPKSAGALVESWLAAAEGWNRESVPFHLVFVW